MRTEEGTGGRTFEHLEVTAFVIIIVVVADVTLWASSCRKPSLPLTPSTALHFSPGSLGLNSVFLLPLNEENISL